MTTATATRGRRRSIVVLAGQGGVSDRGARALAASLAGSGGVLIIRELLRELDRIGRRDVSLVLHRVD